MVRDSVRGNRHADEAVPISSRLFDCQRSIYPMQRLGWGEFGFTQRPRITELVFWANITGVHWFVAFDISC